MSLKNKLHELYWEHSLSQREIGKIINKPQVWVQRQMKKLDIPIRDKTDIKSRFLNYIKQGHIWKHINIY